MNPERVTIWSVDLGSPGAESFVRHSYFDEPERQQASRFVDPRDRQRFLVRRAVRRRVLSTALGVAPESVRITTAAGGKPMLASPVESLEFSATHSGDVAWIALGEGGPLGIDFEMHSPLGGEWSGLVAMFSPAEREQLESLAPQDREPAFFSLWTRKEAVLKAAGVGLRQDLASFSVPLGNVLRPTWVPLLPGAPQWWVQSLPAGAHASSALATTGPVEVHAREFCFG